MASGGSDRDVEYAFSKILQMGMVAEYESEFVVLANRVTGISESLLKSFYISGLKLDLQCLLFRSNPKTLDKAFSLARAAETRFTNLDIWEFLRSNPSTLGEEFFKARITEDRFEIIAKEEKEHIVEKKIDVIVPLQGELASPKAKGSLNADEYMGVEEVVVGGEALEFGEDDDLGDAVTDDGDDAVESGEISILNSLIGHGSLSSLQLWGKIGKGVFMCSSTMDMCLGYVFRICLSLVRIMNPLTAQQCALDEALVTTDDRVIIEKRNMRINPTNEPKEATYQVVLDSLKQTVCYKSFFTTADVPEIYMHPFWSTINKIKDSSSYRFKLDKKRFTKASIRHFMSKDKTISVRNIPFIHGVKDDSVLGFLKFVSKYEIRQVYGKLIPDVLVSREMLESKAYQTYLDYTTGKVIPKESRKRTNAHISFLTADDDIIYENLDDAEKVEVVKPVRKTLKRAVAEEPSKMPTARRKQTGVLIINTPKVSSSKKKAPVRAEKNKGIDLLSDVALLEEAQIKKVIKISKRETHIHHAGGSGDGTSFQPGVPDKPKGKFIGTHEGTGLKLGVPNVSKDTTSESEVITSSNKLIGANPHGECHVGLKIAQGMGIFTLESLSEKAQGVTITDCHASNPCVHIYDPRVENYSLMIKSLYGRDR
ncbi:hypothetical protein Tco_0144869 [Tanacetum coccineum]